MNETEIELLKKLLGALDEACPTIAGQLKSGFIRGEITRRPLDKLLETYAEFKNSKINLN